MVLTKLYLFHLTTSPTKKIVTF